MWCRVAVRDDSPATRRACCSPVVMRARVLEQALPLGPLTDNEAAHLLVHKAPRKLKFAEMGLTAAGAGGYRQVISQFARSDIIRALGACAGLVCCVGGRLGLTSGTSRAYQRATRVPFARWLRASWPQTRAMGECTALPTTRTSSCGSSSPASFGACLALAARCRGADALLTLDARAQKDEGKLGQGPVEPVGHQLPRAANRSSPALVDRRTSPYDRACRCGTGRRR